MALCFEQKAKGQQSNDVGVAEKASPIIREVSFIFVKKVKDKPEYKITIVPPSMEQSFVDFIRIVKRSNPEFFRFPKEKLDKRGRKEAEMVFSFVSGAVLSESTLKKISTIRSCDEVFRLSNSFSSTNEIKYNVELSIEIVDIPTFEKEEECDF